MQSQAIRLAAGLLACLASASLPAATSLWWETAYGGRYNIAVGTGPNSPDRGYAGYTVRATGIDTAALIAANELQPDCRDLRVAYYDGLGWQDLPRHVIDCGTAQTEIRFALVTDLAASSVDDNYYLYFDNPASTAGPILDPTNVYLWYDDATVDRSADYLHGRIDNWHGSGWDDSLAWNPGGWYDYSTGGNATGGYVRLVGERDAYVEAEFMHEGCFSPNMTTGVIVRGVLQSGGSNTQSSNHYFATNRAEHPACSRNGYRHDGDIVVRNRQSTALDGPNPADIVPNTWRRQGLFAWGIEPVRLAFFDADTSSSWEAIGWPGASNLLVGGTSADNVTERGYAGIMTSQDRGRVRNILIRRFVDPEPVLALTREILPANIVLEKSLLTVYDPVNDRSNPKAIPGSWVEYTITATSLGPGVADAGSLIITDALPDNVSLFVGDLQGGMPLAVEAAGTGLSLDFGGLADTTDDVQFSEDGADWTYVPQPDAAGFDPRARHIRVTPGGRFSGSSSASPPVMTIRLRVRVE